MRAQRRALLLAVLALAATGPGAAQEGGRLPVVVTLADGTTFPLRSWTLSYEVGSWRQGSSPAFARFNRVESPDIILGKKSYPTSGARIEIQYAEEEREQEVDGETKKVKIPVARSLTFVTPDKKKATLKPEPPQRDLLLPNSDRELFYQPRSLDLKGETFTGTRRELCLLSFTALVECNGSSGQQVVSLEFPK
jgi:hypothetical protein